MREEAKDRISNLPESALHHIHSFLDIKDGVRTSVLSKRWKCIWTTVPKLHFRSEDKPDPTRPMCRRLCSKIETNEFMDFVDGTLHRHKLSNVDSFSLSCGDHLNESRLRSWISNVISGNVKELSLDINLKHPRCIPLSLFTCQSLVSLELDTRPSIHLPKYITFPRLKHLKLRAFNFNDESWNDQLFSNSPVLEELILKRCIYGICNFSISIPTLKLLEIKTLYEETYDDDDEEINALQDCVFKIDAPRLVTFSYKGYVAKGFVFSSFLGPVEADVNFCFEEHEDAEVLSRLLCALAHVNSLIVSDFTLKKIMSKTIKLPTFHNVKTLNISDHPTTDRGLIVLLKAVPNLESLVFSWFMEVIGESTTDEDDEENNDYPEEDVDEDDVDVSDVAGCDNNDMDEATNDKKDDDRWTALGVVPNGCLLPHLKSVCFQRFVGNPMEMRWVKLILRFAKALQMMTLCYCGRVYCCGIVKSETEVMVDIPCFPRASAGCVFNFSSRNPKIYFFPE